MSVYPPPHALRALACATTAHVPSCARARARVGRVLVLVPSRARARAVLCSCSCARVLRPVRPVAGCFGGWVAPSRARSNELRKLPQRTLAASQMFHTSPYGLCMLENRY